MKGSRELFLSFCLIWFVCPVFIFFLLHKVLDIPSQSLSWSSASVFENRVFVQFSDLHVRLFFHETHFSLLSLVANKSWLAVYVMWNCNSDHPVSWVPAAIIYCPVTNPFALKHSPTTLFQFCIKTDSPCSWPSELVPWFNIFTKEIKQLPCNNRKGLRKMWSPCWGSSCDTSGVFLFGWSCSFVVVCCCCCCLFSPQCFCLSVLPVSLSSLSRFLIMIQDVGGGEKKRKKDRNREWEWIYSFGE